MSSPPRYQIPQPHSTALQRLGQTQLRFLSSHLEQEFVLIALADSWPLNSGWCRYTCSDIKPTSTKAFKKKFELEESLYRISLCSMLLPHLKAEFQRQTSCLLDCGTNQATLVEQVKRVKEIEAIESDSFVPQTFRSSKEVKKSIEPTELQYEPVTIGVGTVDASAPEKEPPPANIPTAIKYQDDNSLAHPNLFIEKAEAEEKWFQRLIALRQERLMGSPVA
ncbi:PREDICTED: serine/Arginine-related protein 53-like [Fulmarus glacialis]|uniref:serine/Arginine-related protein 53-like n=1 Tax=Fulmarus glacialis TaxID=30455 RepID=UPI00051B8C29|nr:PREDICTED: serine/Arginine-related protein 53-like [Fulmarus glacialis]